MCCRYIVHADPGRDLLRIELAGFFDAEGIAGFEQARVAALARLRCEANGHDALVDVRDLQLQSQPMVEAFRRIIERRRTRARRLALITGNAAVRMQVRRVISRPNFQSFTDLTAAEAWLAEPLPVLSAPQPCSPPLLRTG